MLVCDIHLLGCTEWFFSSFKSVLGVLHGIYLVRVIRALTGSC